MTERVLLIDIETKPATVYVWKLFDVNIGIDQVVAPSGTICFGAKWLGEKETMFFSEWEHGHAEMIKAAHTLFNEADAIVTYNGDRFDIPKLMGEFLLLGLTPPAPPTSIDVFKAIKKLGFFSKRLAFIGPALKVGAKVKHEGFRLWTDTMAGCEKARKKMEKYCVQDVVLLEKVYKKIRPYIRNHPHTSGSAPNSCGGCGSDRLQSRGYRRTKTFRIQRLQCQNCGAWQDGKREKAK